MSSPVAASITRRRVGGRAACAAAVVLVATALSGCLGYDGDIQHGYQLDPAAIADVRTGQSAEQVLVTMGSPSTTSTVGGDAWYYIQQKTDRSIAFMKPSITERKIFAVYFDKSKKVTRVVNYGLQDGRVVNFASGTTPTIGAENNFLKGLFLNFNPFGGMMQRS